MSVQLPLLLMTRLLMLLLSQTALQVRLQSRYCVITVPMMMLCDTAGPSHIQPCPLTTPLKFPIAVRGREHYATDPLASVSRGPKYTGRLRRLLSQI
jgi:hypothetical protein